MSKKFIRLTYYRPEKQFGGSSGATNKFFLCNLSSVERITPYENSTKLSFHSGQDIEVVESLEEIGDKIKGG